MKVKLRCKKCKYVIEVDLRVNPLGSMKPGAKSPGCRIKIDKDSLDKILGNAYGASRDELSRIGLEIELDEWEEAQQRMELRKFLLENLRISKEEKQLKGEKYVVATEPWCLPTQKTRILTLNGLKSIEELGTEDLIIGVERGKIIFQHFNEKILGHAEILYQWKTRNMFMEVSEKHRIPILKRQRNNSFLSDMRTAKDLSKYSKFYLDTHFSFDQDIDLDLPDAFLKAVAWYITEGSLRQIRCVNPNDIRITQSKKEENRQGIMEAFKDLGLHPYLDKSGIEVYSKELSSYLSEECKRGAENKRIPFPIEDMSRRQIDLLFDTLLKGDGSKRRQEIHYYTSSSNLRNQMLLLGILRGYSPCFKIDRRRGWLPNYQLSFRRGVKTFKNADLKIRRGDFEVFCLKTRTGNFFVEQEGYVFLTGNSMGDSFRDVDLSSSEIKSMGVDELRMIPGVTMQKKVFGVTKGRDVEELKGIKFLVIIDGSGSMIGEERNLMTSKIGKALLIGKEIHDLTRKLGFDYNLVLFSDRAERVDKKRLKEFWTEVTERARYPIWNGGTRLWTALEEYKDEEYKDANLIIVSDLDISDFTESQEKIIAISKLTNSFKIIIVEAMDVDLEERKEKIKSLFPSDVNLKIMVVGVKTAS